MTSVTLEVEVASQLPAERLLKVFSDFGKIAPKVKPEVFKSVETVEGNGDVGTINIFTYGDAVPFTSGKFKIDAFDLSNYSFSYSCIDGDYLMSLLDSINYHVKIVPSSNGGSVFKQTIIYNCKGDAKASEDILKKERELNEDTNKAVEAYAVAHPEAY